ncbi:MAG: lipid II flippase MurJ [Planctomycetota bacterium]|jgi:putative peptidoglycan lipid II flippase|nr:lipid II flippase MurJ [Planctomycetota bacterium]
MADEPAENAPESDSGEGQQSVLLKIARAAFIILFFQVFWKLGGFLLNVLVSSFWGPSVEADAYLFVSDNVIFLLQTLSLKIAIPVLVPLFKQQKENLGEEKAWDFLNTVVNLVLIVQGLVMVAGMVYASDFIAAAGAGFNKETERLATIMMRWSMPGVFMISFATITYAILNSYNEFGHASAGDAAQKILWVATFFVLGALCKFLGKPVSIGVMILSFLVGAAGNLVAHMIGLKQRMHFHKFSTGMLSKQRSIKETCILAGFGLVLVGLGALLVQGGASQAAVQSICATVAIGYLLLLWWRAKQAGTVMAKFAALLVPLLIGILFAKYRDMFTNYFATFTGKGVYSDLRLARKIGELPNTLIAQAVGIAILPYLSELALGKKWGDFETVLTKTLKIMFMIFIPLTVATVILRESLIDLLLNRGDWDVWHVEHAGQALGLYILALLFFAVENPLQQSFFSMQRMWIPTFLGIVATVFHLLFLFLGIKVWGLDIFVMVALVYPAARIFKGVILVLAMRAIVPILPFRSTAIFAAKVSVACAAGGGAMWFVHTLVQDKLSVDKYRAREVMVDTFNVEARDWNSQNLVEFEIVREPDAPGKNCLTGKYENSSRRRTAIRRDVADLDLSTGREVELRLRCSMPRKFAIALESGDEMYRAAEVKTAADTWQVVKFKTAEVPDSGSWSMLQLWDDTGDAEKSVIQVWMDDLKIDGLLVDDFEPSSEGWRGRGVLQVADLDAAEIIEQLKAWKLPKFQAQRLASSFPMRARQQLEIVDWMSRHAPEKLGEPAKYLIEAIEKDHDAPKGFGNKPDKSVEYCLHPIPKEGAPMVLYRDLKPYRLSGMEQFKFKLRSEKPCELTFNLVTPGTTASAVVEIAESSSRKSYRLSISDFKTESSLALSDVTQIRIDENSDSISGKLWLDNVSFYRPVRRIKFELYKIIHCLIPSLVAAVVFAGLIWVLKVEEASEVVTWLREEGVAKIRKKLGKG